MANKFPLILNTSANQIQEIASGDNLDLTGCKIVGLQGINSAGIVTFTKAHVGAATTWGEDLVVTGNARVTGILTVGTNSVVINGNDVNITGVTTASNFKTGTSNLHNVGIELAGINVLGADTPIGTGATIYNSGAAVFTGIVTAANYVGTINTPAQPNITSVGTLSALNVSGNVSIGGTLTYEDVTNIDAVGLITARNGITVSAGTATFQGAIDANSDLDVDGHTNLDNVSIAGVTTFAGTVNTASIVATGIDLNGDLDVDGHTNLDNVSVAGVTTFFGTTNIDSDTAKLQLGTSQDLQLYHTSNLSTIKNTHANGVAVRSNVIMLQNAAGDHDYLTTENELGVTLFYDNAPKLKTTTNGVSFGTAASDILLISGQTLYRNGSNGSGVHFTTGAIYPTNNSGANNNGATNLGGTSNKFGTLFSTLVKSDRVDCDGLFHIQYGNATNTNYMSSISNSNGIMHLFRGDGLYIGNNMNTSNQAGGPNNKAITLGTNGAVNASGTVTAGSLVINGSAVQNHDSSDTNHTDNSLPAAASGFYVRNGNGTTGTFTSIGLIASSTGASSDQSASLLAKCTGSGLSPEVYLTQRDGNNSQRNTVAINTIGDITLIGNVTPSSDNTQNLGSGSKRWANIYTGDLNLSNEGSTNSVDGTWGSYTIEEGESDLFLHNKRTGKKYKFNLTEV